MQYVHEFITIVLNYRLDNGYGQVLSFYIIFPFSINRLKKYLTTVVVVYIHSKKTTFDFNYSFLTRFQSAWIHINMGRETVKLPFVYLHKFEIKKSKLKCKCRLHLIDINYIQGPKSFGLTISIRLIIKVIVNIYE